MRYQLPVGTKIQRGKPRPTVWRSAANYPCDCTWERIVTSRSATYTDADLFLPIRPDHKNALFMLPASAAPYKLIMVRISNLLDPTAPSLGSTCPTCRRGIGSTRHCARCDLWNFHKDALVEQS